MSTSPQISPPKTPDDPKRKRSPTPPPLAVVPMAGGIKEIGFRLRAELLVNPETHGDSPTGLCKDMGTHLVEVAEEVSNPSTDFAATVQSINTLFEIAAALATVVVSDDPDVQAKLDVLHQHAVEGLDLIGGAE